MKVEGKLKYYSQYLLNTFSDSNFEETLKSIKVALEDCEDEVVDLVIDLEEEKELKHKHRMDDLNRKLLNLRNAVSEHEKVSRTRRTHPNNDSMHPEPVSQVFAEDDRNYTTATATESVATPSLPKETFKSDKTPVIVSHISSSIQDSISNTTTKHNGGKSNNVALVPEYINKKDIIVIDEESITFDKLIEQDKAADTDEIVIISDTHVVNGDDQDCGPFPHSISELIAPEDSLMKLANSNSMLQQSNVDDTIEWVIAQDDDPAPVPVPMETVPYEIHIETHMSAQPDKMIEPEPERISSKQLAPIYLFAVPVYRKTVSPEIYIETHTSQTDNKEKECIIIDDSSEEEEHHETIEDEENMEGVIFGKGNAELVATISPDSECNKMIEPEPEKRAKCTKRGHPNMTMDMELSEQPHPENKEWITVKGDAYLPFVEFGGRYKLYKCLSRACAQSNTLVVNKGINRNSFHVHCKQKHRLKIVSIRRRTGEIISIRKPRCSKCEKEFSREQTAKEHEEKCMTDLKKGNSCIKYT